jgi:hypothetical protein
VEAEVLANYNPSGMAQFQLTLNSIETVEKGEVVRFTESGPEFVLLPVGVFGCLKAMLYDVSRHADEVPDASAREAGRVTGWDELDAYASSGKL